MGSVVERSQDAVVVVDHNRRYVDANHEACRLFGVPREALVGQRIDDLTEPEARDAIDKLWGRFIEEGVELTPFELGLPAGERAHLEYRATANLVPGSRITIRLREAELGSDPEQRVEPLTPREREVLQMIALGAGTREIGARLLMAPDTARTHAQNAMRKLGARNRAHAVALAVKRDLIEI